MNSVSMVGRLTRDPELRSTTTGKSVASFSIAVNKRIKPTDGSPDAYFFRCSVWGHPAEFLTNYGGKGRLISINGRLENRKFTDNSGNEREVTEIIADTVALLDRAPGGEGGGNSGGYDRQSRQQPQQATAKPSADDYDPFADE